MMMPPDAHAKVSPSRLSRILECPASFDYAQRFQSQQSSYANEGTQLHAAVEKYLRTNALTWLNKEIQVSLHIIDPPLDIEQINAVKDCLAYLAGLMRKLPNADLFIEQEVSLHEYHARLFDCWGTCDIILQADDELHVIDWKFGKGVPVYAHNNDQLYAYACGAAKNIDSLKAYKRICIHCVQPRLDSYDVVELEPANLQFWLESRVIPGLTEAYSDSPRFNPGSSQCRWCPAKERCKHRYQVVIQTAEQVFAAHLKLPTEEVTYEELNKLLDMAPLFDQCISDIKLYLMSKIKSGEQLPYWKLVAGRTSRQWSNLDKTVNILSEQLDTDQLYVSKLISPPEAEKLLGKKAFKILDEEHDLVTKVPGNPTLVSENDKRPALVYRGASQIFANLNEEN